MVRLTRESSLDTGALILEVEVILHREDALESIGCGRGQNRGIIAKRWSRELPQTSRVRDMSRTGAEWVMKPTEMKSGWAAA